MTSGATAVVAGDSHGCAVIAGGEVRCWGQNGSGQLGDGTTTTPSPQALVAVKVVGGANLTGIIGLSAGYDFTCGRSATAIWCWGDGYSGQLGDEAQTPSPFAVEAKEKPDISLLSIVATHLVSYARSTCAFKGSDGTVLCWGAGSSGQSAARPRTSSSRTIAGISGATASRSARRTDEPSWRRGDPIWGLNNRGHLGTGVRFFSLARHT